MGTDEFVWWVHCAGDALPESLASLGQAQKDESERPTVWRFSAPRAVIDQQLPELLGKHRGDGVHAAEVQGAACSDSDERPTSLCLTRRWEYSGALVVSRQLAQRIWTAAELLGGPWDMHRHSTKDGFFEDPVTMCWDSPDDVELCLEPRTVYGSRTYYSWMKDPSPRDLRGTKEWPGSYAGGPIEVCSYAGLVDKVAFLAVMNKSLTLLLRGQTSDRWPMLASIHREKFSVPGSGDDPMEMEPGKAVDHYLRQLQRIQGAVFDVLDARGLPRRMHLVSRPAAIWAVIQHYELWPTPLLDLTTSLRVAASFAFGFERDERGNPTAEDGFVFVFGVPTVTGDLMQPRGASLAIRLNSVCPPSARRPHLQDGVLVGRDDPKLIRDDPRVAAIPIAKLRLDNSNLNFWRDTDFPPLSKGSLLPEADSLRQELQGRLEYVMKGDRWTVSARKG